MSILYEPFKDDDAIQTAIERWWETALLELVIENDCGEADLTNDQITDRAWDLAVKEARK